MSKKEKRLFLVLNNKVLFPNFNIKIDIKKANFNEKQLKNDFKAGNEILLIPEKLTENVFGIVGTIGEVIEVTKKDDLTLTLTLIGKERAFIDRLFSPTECYILAFNEEKDDSEKSKILVDQIKVFLSANQKSKNISIFSDPLFNSSNSMFSDALIMMLDFSFKEKIEHLQQVDIEKRLENIFEILKQKMEDAAKVAGEVDVKVRKKLSKQQKEFYLREQLKVIKDELDEISGEENEVKSFIKKAKSNPYPKAVKEKIIKEANRLENTPSSSPEAGVIRNYLDWLMNIPWWQKSDSFVDIQKTQDILDNDHYGLIKPKQRIIEYLSVQQNNPNAKGMIISLVGPPGTGKTSIAKSIARALGREFVKISLGGVKDESEIRGHRRTYIASMPGKIIQGIRKAGTTNPVILLDEIDKLSSDYKGDPSSALLEALDYEQNNKFQDHFIEEEYDLSNVLFITTANYIQNIPEPLYDRLEIIELSSYTELEKIEIAKLHLIPRVLKETALSSKMFSIDDTSIKYLIRHYTIEAGVRQLYRVLETIARKIIVLKLSGKVKLNYKITISKITELLGPIKFDFTRKSKHPEIGVVNGLAWTSYGGDILPIEVTFYPGKGNINVTGQLKDVMKESSEIALSYVKSMNKTYNIPLELNGKKLFEDYDIHIHSPDGATPKDGPSAGVTFTTAMISALTNKPVSQDIGMTGEITLTGKILPIGGLKEKSISAYRSGLKLIFIPKENMRDLIDIPKEVKDNLKIIPVEKYEEIYTYLRANESSL